MPDPLVGGANRARPTHSACGPRPDRRPDRGLSTSPAWSRSMAMAPITALSVQSCSGATCSRTPCRWASSASRWRSRALAATPPPTHSVRMPGLLAGPPAPCPPGSRPPPPESWRPGRRPGCVGQFELLEVGLARPGDRVADGRLQAAEAEVEPVFVLQQRPGKGVGPRVARRGRPARSPARRDRQPQHGGHLVERLAGGVVDRRAEQLELQRPAQR